jgi:hypothetical protein
MPGPADDSTRTLRDAQAVLVRQREGGRRLPVRQSIGRGSAELKARHYRGKLQRIVAAVVAVVLAVTVGGLTIGGIGLGGLMAAVLAGIILVALLATFPRLPTPRLDQLNRGDVRGLVGRTELWLEAQRPALPPPAVALVDRIGVQLDALGLQLAGIDPSHPAAQEVRGLVGEHLPAMVESYRRIPPQLRSEDRGGGTPDRQLEDGLGKISAELDDVTRQIAAGDLDSLAIRGRYLDYRYGGDLQDRSNP